MPIGFGNNASYVGENIWYLKFSEIFPIRLLMVFLNLYSLGRIHNEGIAAANRSSLAIVMGLKVRFRKEIAQMILQRKRAHNV